MKDFQAKQIEKEIPSKQAAWPFPGTFGAYQEKLKAEEEMVKPRVLDKGAWKSALYDYEHSNFWLDIDRNGKKVSKPVYPKIMQEILPPDEFNRRFSLEKDPNGKSLNESGSKADAGKLRGWLCLAGFSHALEKVANVTTIGALKYTPNGWAEVPDGYHRYMDAFARHLFSYGEGKVLDNGPGGTGCEHMAQMIWNLLAAYELQLRATPVEEDGATSAYVSQ